MNCVRFAVLLIVMQYIIKKCLLLYVHLMALLPLHHPGVPLVALLRRSNFTVCFSSSSGTLPVLFANSLLSVFLLLFLTFFQTLSHTALKNHVSLLFQTHVSNCSKCVTTYYHFKIVCFHFKESPHFLYK